MKSRLLLLAALGLAVVPAAYALPAPATSPAAPQAATPALPAAPPVTSKPRVLAADVLPGLKALPSSATDPSTPMQVGVILSNPHAADLDRAYAALYTEGSPQYHQFLSADEAAAQLGTPAATAAAVLRWATRDGMAPTFVAPTNDYVLLQGTATQVERTFGVALRTFSGFVANTNAPAVPAGVDSVIGLNTKLGFHTPARPAPARTAQDTCLPVGGCVGLTTPQDLWSVYDQATNLHDPNADFGQGQQMAILGEGAVKGTIADLRAFENQFGLPHIPVTIHSVADDFKDTAGAPEWDIDTQASTGMAPKAAGETLYFAKDLTDSSVLADITAWATDKKGPLQASASFGECEQDPTSTPGFNNTTGVLAGSAGVAFTRGSERALELAAVLGKTLFVSTGDSGSSCGIVGVNLNGVANQAVPETEYPASSRYAVAVGGTVLYTSGTPAKRAMENAWTYSGGGNTLYIPEPKFQKGISLLDSQPCIAQPNGTPYSTPTPCRGIPDVAAISGDIVSNGYNVTMGGVSNSAGGGTSLSSPLWMGMWTRVAAAAAKPLGFADETLYRIGKNPAQDAQAFFDVGGSQSTPAGNGYYTALPRSPLDPSGWDYVSGLGTPDVRKLTALATGRTTPFHNVTAAAPKDCNQPGLAPCPTSTAPACAAGQPLWTNPPHTATDTFGNSDPQLSLAAGNMTVTSSGQTLDVSLTLEDLSRTLPPGATGAAWYATWVFKGTTYFASAELGVDGSVTYSDGTFASKQYSAAHTDTGTFGAGNGGTITIHVPVGDIGNPGPGATLSQPAADTYTEEGVPATALAGGTGALAHVDNGGPGCPFTM